jgi:3-dehydroquinate dehydratase-2
MGQNSVKTGQIPRNCGKLAAMKNASKGGKAASSGLLRPRKVLVLHGPNLNLLGSREPEIYGAETLQDIHKRLLVLALKAGASLDSFQSNSEAELVERVQKAGPARVDFVIINPAAFTHTSVALRDALAAVRIPYIEVHLSNVHAREPFRRHSYFSDQAVGVICGLGSQGYEYALQCALTYIARK